MPRYIVVFITASSRKEGEKIAQALVQEKLAACVNVIDAVTSVFSWKGKVCKEREALLVAKTRRRLFKRLAGRVKALHSYEVPEIIGLPIEKAWRPYLEWLAQETQ